MATTTTLNLNSILPGHPAQDDACTRHLSSLLLAERGVNGVRFADSAGQPGLLVQHDSQRLPVRRLNQLAHTAGNDVRARYRHETIKLADLDSPEQAATLEAALGRFEGIQAVEIDSTTGLVRILHDTKAVTRSSIDSAITDLGYRVLPDGPDNSAGARKSDKRAQRPDSRVLGVSRELFLSLLAGASLLTGWVGATFFGLSPTVAWLLYLVAYVSGGWDATHSAVRAALKGRFDIDVLMIVAALGAAALGQWAEGALLLFLFSLSHALEHYAMDRARGAISALADLTPKTARVRRAGREQQIPVSELRIGDTVIVRAGERLPADGLVLDGTSSIDQAPITGESLPVAKETGDAVFAGTINGDGALEVQTTKGPEDTTLARVIRAVEGAQSVKAPTHRFTDRFQRTFTPIILIVTILVIALPPLFGVPFNESFIRAMILLVAASPCALALATPSAVLAGIARAARSGVLIKGGAHLENTGSADVVVFDKTGTLTRGKPTVTDIWSSGMEENELLRLAAAIETRSGHPLADAIVRAAEERNLQLPLVDDFQSVQGKGIRASVAGADLMIGNDKLMQDARLTTPAGLKERNEALERQGKTSMLLARNGELIGIIAVRDEPREGARATITALKNQGVKHTVMLTGDNPRVAEAVAHELGIDEVHAGLLPEDKAEQIKALQERYGKVIMVGDGVNDAPAMATADVGIAMGGAGTDVALETADIALMADDLTKLPYAIALSRASRRMIIQNLIISLGVIALLVPSALFGLATIGIAIVLHETSTLVVVANALRLLGFKTRTAVTGNAPPSPDRAPRTRIND